MIPNGRPGVAQVGLSYIARRGETVTEDRCMTDQPAEWISSSSPQLSAAVNPFGAQLSVLRDGSGRDLLWNGDPAIWAGRAPILFPTIGELAGGSFRVGPRTSQRPRHGFARNKPFEVVAAPATEATFRL